MDIFQIVIINFNFNTYKIYSDTYKLIICTKYIQTQAIRYRRPDTTYGCSTLEERVCPEHIVFTQRQEQHRE